MPDLQELQPMPESSNTLPASNSPQDVATFRHDMRNALASALLCADILGTHKDKAVQQNAKTIVDALENALKLLKNFTSSR
ncbi:HAMP domain-containing histidine kinase [Gluconobacter sp. R75690]|nr:HAMP domain-containing histidine kinase [Gluconobacter sp. R75690]MBF0878142.1 HAMP domain-containing histidine kinase [Gluconobacter sp. R75828]